MRLFRVVWCITLFLTCLAATVTAQDPGTIGIGGGGGAAVNSITIVTIDTSTTKKSANIAGTYTTQDEKTELTSIDGYAFPTAGGVVSKGGGGDQNPAVVINKTNKTWTSVIVASPALTKQSYQFRVNGTFSAGPKAVSQYFAATPDGDAPGAADLTLTWGSGFPKSTASKKISSAGTYLGNPNADVAKIVYISKTMGGPEESTGDITLNPNLAWSAADITASAGSTQYSAIAIMIASDGKTYCSTIGNVTTMP